MAGIDPSDQAVHVVLSDARPRPGRGEIRDALDGLRPPPALVDLAVASGATWVTPNWTAGLDAGDHEPIEGLDLRIVGFEDEVRRGGFDIFGDPMIWFVNHRLWDLSNAPDVRRQEVEAYTDGFRRINVDVAEQAAAAVADVSQPIVFTYGYHLLTAAATLRALRPDADLRLYVPTAWGAPEDWRVIPPAILEEIYRALLSNDVIAFPARRHARAFIRCCVELFDLEGDVEKEVVLHDDRVTSVRTLPVPVDAERLDAFARTPKVIAKEEYLLTSRRQYSLLSVGDADLSRNVLRSLTSFDLLLDQHPEYKALVTFTQIVWPVRQDIAEYAEYLERIEALIAVINHRHGSSDWMPIFPIMHEDPEEIVAHLKTTDVLVALALSEGVNPFIEAGAVVSQRDATLVLSTGTSAYEQLRHDALAVQPFDIQGVADAYHQALSASFDRRAELAARLRGQVTGRGPEDWLAQMLEPSLSQASG